MRKLSDVLKQQYGEKIYKLSLTSGCTCPNRDGTLDTRGCIFCSAGGSGEFASDPALSVYEQIEEGKALLKEWGLSENLVGVASMALGYADCEHPVPKPRKEDYIVRV